MSNDSSNRERILVQAQPLTEACFAPFGAVIETGSDQGRLVNQNRARRIRGVHDLWHDSAAERPVLDLYRIDPSNLPFTVSCFERHPLSCQVFIPMAVTRFLVVVAPDNAGFPDPSGMVAFIGTGMQAVHYRAGTWHAPMVALDTVAVMTMLMWETGDARDCEEASGYGQVWI